MKIHEVTAGQVAGAADNLSTGASIGQFGAMGGAKIASKLAPAANVGSKFTKFIPGLGLVASGADAVRRASAGDWAGAGLSAASGVAGLVPGVGTAASLGLAGLQAYRDKQRTGSYMPDTDQIAQASGKGTVDGFRDQAPAAAAPAAAAPTALPPGADPKVYALQRQLIAKGAKITADGKMGPRTQTAMKQFGMVEGLKENTMSNSEKMAQLRDRLIKIEKGKSEPLNETPNPLPTVNNIWNTAKGAVSNIGKGWDWGVKNPKLAATIKNAPNATVGQKAANTAAKTAGAIARNPGKSVAGAAAAGAALGAGGTYLATRPKGGGEQRPPPKPPGPKPPGPKPAPSAGGLTPEELEELDAIAQEMENINDPLIISLAGSYAQVRPGLPAPKAPAPVPSQVPNQPGVPPSGGQTGPITKWVKRTDLGPEYIPGVTPAAGPGDPSAAGIDFK